MKNGNYMEKDYLDSYEEPLKLEEPAFMEDYSRELEYQLIMNDINMQMDMVKTEYENILFMSELEADMEAALDAEQMEAVLLREQESELSNS